MTKFVSTQVIGDLFVYLTNEGQVAGWKLSDAPKNYRGEELFLVINGGADIYQEYGFRQVLHAEYMDGQQKSVFDLQSK